MNFRVAENIMLCLKSKKKSHDFYGCKKKNINA